MNETSPAVAVPDTEETIRLLQNSLYPGAKPESIMLVMAYCYRHGIDPFLKAVHIVPMSVKTGKRIWDQKNNKEKDEYETRDVIMPGIAEYRIKASRTNLYAGKTEPEFGPSVELKTANGTWRVPEWCRVTVFRLVEGQPRPFPAKEYWRENYATKSRWDESPNDMWARRPYAQLAKVSEAQALRMAFPEFAGANTNDEMEGRTLSVELERQPMALKRVSRETSELKAAVSEVGTVYDPATGEVVADNPDPMTDVLDGDGISALDPNDKRYIWVQDRIAKLKVLPQLETLHKWLGSSEISDRRKRLLGEAPALHTMLEAAIAEAERRLLAETKKRIADQAEQTAIVDSPAESSESERIDDRPGANREKSSAESAVALDQPG